MSIIHRILFYLELFLIAFSNVHGHLNVFLNQHEVMRLLGKLHILNIKNKL